MKKVQRYLVRDFFVYSFVALKAAIKSSNMAIFFNDLKYFSKWWQFRKLGGGTFDHQIPWLAFGAIEFLDSYLDKKMKLFEYGSGGSTIYFSGKVDAIISVEHNLDWFDKVNIYIVENKITNITYRCFPAAPDLTFETKVFNNPNDFISVLGDFKGMSFENYVKSIDSFENEYFDLVAVDGRARISCIAKAIPKIKKQGLLLVDNTNREYYLKPFPELNDRTKWKKYIFNGHYPFFSASVIDCTTIFQRI